MLDIQKLAETTLRNPLATDAEKKKAKQAIRRLDAHEQNKMEITESCGKKPTRKNFANEQECPLIGTHLIAARFVNKQSKY